MAMTPVFVLLLQRADNPKHADRAWGRMLLWEPPAYPSVLSEQVDEALALTKDGNGSRQPSRFDEGNAAA